MIGTETRTLLRVRGVSKTYRRGSEQVRALREVSFELHPGEFVALIGPSGSGKSTLLAVLAGWESADEGEVEWNGGSTPVPLADRPWSEVAVVPQTLGLLDDLPVAENVALPIRLLEASPERKEALGRRAEGLLDRFGLAGYRDRDPDEISLGEQQRTALARALVLSPSLLLADEPTGHQDAEWARVVFEAIRAAAETGTTSLVATHHHEAVRFAHRILAIRDGRVQALDRGAAGRLIAE